MLSLVRAQGWESAFAIDSAGTAAYHIGKRPDPRTLAAAQRRGLELPSRGRQFTENDFLQWDYVVAMDRDNRRQLLALSAGRFDNKIVMLRDFDPESPPGSCVPDPYYGGADGFEEVLDLCFRACGGLLAHLQERHNLSPAG